MRICLALLAMILSTSLYATSTKKIEIDPKDDSERAQNSDKIKFTATLKNDSGTVLSEYIEIWYQDKQGKRIETNSSNNGVVSINVPKTEVVVYRVRAKSGTTTGGPVKVVIVGVELLKDANHFPDTTKGKAKLLATAAHQVGAKKVTPAGEKEAKGTFDWTHPRAQNFKPPHAMETAMTAKAEITPAKDQDLLTVKFTVTSSGESCTDDEPLNVTAPKKFSSAQDGMLVVNATLPGKGWYRSDNRGVIAPFIKPTQDIQYDLADQFGEPMDQSDHAEKVLQDKENLPEGWGGFSAAWAKANINRGNPNQGTWTTINVAPNSFKDTIGIADFPLDILMVQELNDPNKPDNGKHWRLHPDLRAKGKQIITLLPHQWKVSINQKMVETVAKSTLEIEISDYMIAPKNDKIDMFKISVRYKVKVVK